MNEDQMATLTRLAMVLEAGKAENGIDCARQVAYAVALRALLAASNASDKCVGCEGNPTNENSPCGVSEGHIRYSEPIEKRPGRRRTCHCGCCNPRTHRGMANGVALTSACELGIARWVKTGSVRPITARIDAQKEEGK